MGYKVVIPPTAYKMRKAKNFDVDVHKTWYKNPEDYWKKQRFMDWHFREIKKGDGILVANYDKKGIKGYIGGNVLMKIAIAYYFKKPIFILFDIEENSPIKEEVYGVNPVFLRGDITKLLL